MHPRKQMYAQDVYKLVNMCCKTMSDGDKANIHDVLHISNKNAHDIINKVMIALPDSYFYNANSTMLHDMLAFISKSLILFQVQENIKEKAYAYHLVDFINSLTKQLAIRYYH